LKGVLFMDKKINKKELTDWLGSLSKKDLKMMDKLIKYKLQHQREVFWELFDEKGVENWIIKRIKESLRKS